MFKTFLAIVKQLIAQIFSLVVLAHLNLLGVIIKKMIVVLIAKADAKVNSKLSKTNVAGLMQHEVSLIPV